MKANIRIVEAIKKLNDKIDNIKIKEPKDGKDGKSIKKVEIINGELVITIE